MPTALSALLESSDALEGVLEFVRSLRTYMDVRISSGRVVLDTRDNGDIGSETPGKEDIIEAKRVAAALRANYPTARVTTSTEDEWVTVEVAFPAQAQLAAIKRAASAGKQASSKAVVTPPTFKRAVAEAVKALEAQLRDPKAMRVTMRVQDITTWLRGGETLIVPTHQAVFSFEGAYFMYPPILAYDTGGGTERVRAVLGPKDAGSNITTGKVFAQELVRLLEQQKWTGLKNTEGGGR